MTIAAGFQIAPEAHPYSETLTVIRGELQCVIEDEPPITLSAGHTIHIAPDCQHHIVNTASTAAHLSMLIGA
jgi:quercetin dioxygenase-like cupin family protein